MMIGPYPGSPDKIDGGAASALTYLSQELAGRADIDLVGIRIADTSTASQSMGDFGWPIADLPLGRLGLATQYRQQRQSLETLVDRFRPDIIHAQGIDLPGFIAVHSGVPSVVTVHGILSEETRYGADLKSRARSFLSGWLLERPTVRRASDLISISPYVTAHYGNLIGGRIHDVPNAIAPKYFGIRRSAQRGRLLFAGRIIKRKGVLDLIRAVAASRRPDTRLVLAGAASDPGYESLVREEVSRLGMVDRIEFRGLLDEASMLEEFSLAEALVLPSYQETAPMVVQQAMAAGLAVVATRICGLPYQVEHEVTGLLYEAGAIDELTRFLSRIADDASLTVRMGDAGRKAALERFHAARVADATIRVYESMYRRATAGIRGTARGGLK